MIFSFMRYNFRKYLVAQPQVSCWMRPFLCLQLWMVTFYYCWQLMEFSLLFIRGAMYLTPICNCSGAAFLFCITGHHCSNPWSRTTTSVESSTPCMLQRWSAYSTCVHATTSPILVPSKCYWDCLTHYSSCLWLSANTIWQIQYCQIISSSSIIWPRCMSSHWYPTASYCY